MTFVSLVITRKISEVFNPLPLHAKIPPYGYPNFASECMAYLLEFYFLCIDSIHISASKILPLNFQAP